MDIIPLMKKPFKWDSYSDQPYQLKDKTYKQMMRKRELSSLLKTIFLSLLILPLSIIITPFAKKKKADLKHFFCLGVDFQREVQTTLKLLDELDVNSILIRFKLWEMDSLKELKNFILSCKNKHITLKIMQDREHIEDLNLLQKDLETVFSLLNGLVDIYEVGTTINRAKWGFFSVNEYNKFFQTAYDLKTKKFPDIKLIGSGVIDFEYHFTIHTLFNLFRYKYDGVASLLYVDRRGAPENTQMGFNLSDKIALLSTMVWLSPKTKHKLYITETNWPIKGTAPYAPTSEFECIDTNLYADYMLRYYLLAFASSQVELVSWHQLIASGYGLVDNRDEIKKYPAFQTYKTMIKHLKYAQFLRMDIKRGHYILQCLVDEQLLQIHWSLKPITIKNEDYFEVYDRDDNLINDEILNIDSSPLYIYNKNF